MTIFIYFKHIKFYERNKSWIILSWGICQIVRQLFEDIKKFFMCTSMSHTFLVSFHFYFSYFQDFEAHVRVTNVHSGEVYVVRERVENKRVTLKMYRYTEEKPHLCIYSRSSGFGHTVYGKYKVYFIDFSFHSWNIIGSTQIIGFSLDIGHYTMNILKLMHK